MPVTEKKYPDWVQKYRIKGTTVKIKEIRIISIKGHPDA